VQPLAQHHHLLRVEHPGMFEQERLGGALVLVGGSGRQVIGDAGDRRGLLEADRPLTQRPGDLPIAVRD
jgi:hypothetical protein